jgi:hypothetical protein
MYMEITVLGLSIIQSMGISLGVGGSTLAILNFFHAIADGKIDETERNFMGVTYLVLRVAMGIILVTSLLLAFIGYLAHGSDYFTGYVTAQALLTGALFINAFLMTLHYMPSTFGPAIQASTWYSLGFLLALYAQGHSYVHILVFIFAYSTFVFFAVSFINSVMAYLKDKREKAESGIQ